MMYLNKLNLWMLLLLSSWGAWAGPVKSHFAPPHSVIIYIWDGLRPDAITPQITPNLYALMQKGVQFSDNHSTFPTFTMMNAASFATGDRAGKTGFFGNTLWHPGVKGTDSAGNKIDFNQPVFTEDYKILQDLAQDHLFFVHTLFQAAHEKNLTTAVVGKSGPAFIQDYQSQGLILDEKEAFPLPFAKALQAQGYSLPRLAPLRFPSKKLMLAEKNDAPTLPKKIYYLQDGLTADASDTHGSPFNSANTYMMQIYLHEILVKTHPVLSIIWMRNPDNTEHVYGPGSANYYSALKSNDKLLGELLDTLQKNHLAASTNIIIASDHSHSSISGPLNEFPLRTIHQGKIGEISQKGFSVSGEIRTADLLTKAGFHAYDGVGCTKNRIMAGVKTDGSYLYPLQVDKTGAICEKAGVRYVTPSYKVPKVLPHDAIIVAGSGGSDYFYVPSHDKKIVKNLVRFLASHTQYDALFVNSARYGQIEGTLSQAMIGIENPQGRSPDVVAGLSYQTDALVQGLAGIEFSDTAVGLRGMHGSFSPRDVHNVLIVSGPDFCAHWKDSLPTANVDVAPTVAYLLGLKLAKTDGRILWEALVKTHEKKSYSVKESLFQSAVPLEHLTIYNALNQLIPQSTFTTQLHKKELLTGEGEKYEYFDWAKGVREDLAHS